MSASGPPRPRPLVLCILDGFGERAERDGNAIRLARTPHLEALAAYPHTLLRASVPDVGLPTGRVGDCESGHRNLAAGRVVPTEAARIDAAIADKTLRANPVVDHVFHLAKHHHSARLH